MKQLEMIRNRKEVEILRDKDGYYISECRKCCSPIAGSLHLKHVHLCNECSDSTDLTEINTLWESVRLLFFEKVLQELRGGNRNGNR